MALYQDDFKTNINIKEKEQTARIHLQSKQEGFLYDKLFTNIIVPQIKGTFEIQAAGDNVVRDLSMSQDSARIRLSHEQDEEVSYVLSKHSAEISHEEAYEQWKASNGKLENILRSYSVMNREYDKAMDLKVEQHLRGLVTEKGVSTSNTPTDVYSEGNMHSLTGNDQFTESADCDPVKEIKLAKNKIKQLVGTTENLNIVMHDDVWQAMQSSDKLKRHCYGLGLGNNQPVVTFGSDVTKEVFAANFGFKNVFITERTVRESTGATPRNLYGNDIIIYISDYRQDTSSLSMGYSLELKGQPKMVWYATDPVDPKAGLAVFKSFYGYSFPNMKAGYLIKDCI
jgi:hypothetical protein